MSNKTFRIKQRDDLLPKGESPLSLEELEFHLSYLPNDLTLFFEGKGLEVTAERTAREVVLSLPEELNGQKTSALLSEFLGKLNVRTQGLALGW
jgi:hypothetical protein